MSVLRLSAWLAVPLLALRVSAQVTDVTCSSVYSWMDNSHSQNPCLVAAYLEGVCSGSQWTVSSLVPGNEYVGPTTINQSPCLCNTVVYSLISACGACQNALWITWSAWSTNCSSISTPGTYPETIPSGTAVPAWAYLDVVTSDLFNLTQADIVGDAPESTAVPKPTLSPTSASSSSSSALPVSVTSVPASSSSKKSSNAGAIAGGVVGGVVGLALIAALIAFFVVRSRRTAQSSSATSAAPAAPMSPPPVSEYGTVVNGYNGPHAHEKLYDPSDPSTFPTTPNTAQVDTLSYDTSLAYNQPPHQHSIPVQAGQYGGAPEV